MSDEQVQPEKPYGVCLLGLEHQIADDIQFKNGIIAGPPPSRLRNAIMDMAKVLRPDQKWEIQNRPTWLTAEVKKPELQVVVQQQILDTAIGLQVASPIGCEYFIALTHAFSSAGDSVLDRGSLTSPEWSRRTAPQLANATDCQFIVDTVVDAFTNKSRIVNPLRLFELGLQSDQLYIRTMLWTTALDGLLMAVQKQLFIDRLCKYLGEGHAVFPPVPGITVRQMTLRDVALNLFELRSNVAHGVKISEKFCKPLSPVVPASGAVAYDRTPTLAAYLEEASLLLLTTVLRKIIHEDIGIIDHPKVWRSRLS